MAFTYTPLSRDTLARAEALNTIFEAIKNELDNIPSTAALLAGTTDYSADTGSANAYVLTLDNPPDNYVAGMRIAFRVATENTGASTVNVNGLGVKQLRDYNGDELGAGVLTVGDIVSARYDGTVFRCLGIPQLADNGATNAKLADMAEARIKGRASGAGTGDPTDLTAAQVQTILQSGLDARYAVRANNLSDLTNAATARSNLGLGTAALVNTGTSGANVPTVTQADARYVRPGEDTLITGVLRNNSTNTFLWYDDNNNRATLHLNSGYYIRHTDADNFVQIVLGSSEAARIDPAGTSTSSARSIVTVEKGDGRYARLSGATNIFSSNIKVEGANGGFVMEDTSSPGSYTNQWIMFADANRLLVGHYLSSDGSYVGTAASFVPNDDLDAMPEASNIPTRRRGDARWAQLGAANTFLEDILVENATGAIGVKSTTNPGSFTNRWSLFPSGNSLSVGNHSTSTGSLAGTAATFVSTEDLDILPNDNSVPTRRRGDARWLQLSGDNIPGPYADDAAAATGGVAVDEVYSKTDGTLTKRVS